jgi:hypothetical protein
MYVVTGQRVKVVFPRTKNGVEYLESAAIKRDVIKI